MPSIRGLTRQQLGLFAKDNETIIRFQKLFQAVADIQDELNDMAQTVDDNNSSTTPLAGGGVFTGEWISILNYGIVFVNVFSDQESAIDGLEIQQSSDGTNADHGDSFDVPANTGKNFSINPYARYMRVVYTNGTTLQTVFRIQTLLKSNSKPSTHRINDDITTQDDAELVTSVLKVKANDLEQFKNIEYMYPMPVSGASTFPHDLNIANSDFGGFSGDILDIFDNRFTTSIDSSATNPKVITLNFERTIQSTSFGFACATGDFSNIIVKWGITGVTDQLFYDGSADSTKRTFITFPTIPLTFSRIILEFHTADPVSISFFAAAKAYQRISQIQGETDAEDLINIGATFGGNLKVSMQEFGDTPAIDAFGRLRVSEPYTIFDSKHLHDKQPLFWDESIGGSATATHSQPNACIEMVVTASATDFIIRQTRQRFNYQPGKSELVFFTFHIDPGAGVNQKLGLFDGTGTNDLTPNNGIFLEIDGTSVSWNIAKNGSTTETVAQANWNVDKFDGTGPSGVTLDIDATHIGVIDMEWLGVGRVRIGFVINGLPYYAHYFYHANDPTFQSVYMSSPNLPMRYQITSDGTAVGQLDHICSTVISEGGIEETGILRSVDTENIHLDADLPDVTYALLGIRLKSAYIDITVLPEYMSMISETNDDFKWSLHLNPTISGTFTYADVSNSAIQKAAGVTANSISSDGLIIDSGYAQSNTSVDRKFSTALRIGSLIDGTQDELVLAVTPLSSNADIQGSLTFRELL